ncbi:MAG: kinase-like domain-containing protein [Monoraphidium minutum]|nr:MAG: kinase-like domain-containing protein [Monoraphidium minutum]
MTAADAPGGAHAAPASNGAAAAPAAPAGGAGAPDGGELWAKARDAVMGQVGVSSAFKTLRDRDGGGEIPEAALKSVGLLGEGAFARVESAWYTPEGSPPSARYLVAVKHLKPELFSSPADLKLFRQEVGLMRKLQYRNIVAFIGAGSEAGGGEFVVQEYMGGGTLKQLVTRQMLAGGRRLYSDAQALDICLQMARGLRYLHSASPMVIHRDLKLENVLLKSGKTEEGRYDVKIADFGLSRSVHVRASAQEPGGKHTKLHAAGSTALTTRSSNEPATLERMWSARAASAPPRPRAGSITNVAASFISRARSGPVPPRMFELTGRTGSLMYMSPEVFKEQPYNEKADVFSFAMLMYEVMQRYVMFSAVSIRGDYEELVEYCGRVAEGYRPPLHTTWPPSVASVITDCWAQDPAKRPSMGEVVTRLEAAEAAGVLGELRADDVNSCSCAIA